MATQSRRTDPPLKEILLDLGQGYRFRFFQAVRVLERLYPDHAPVGYNAAPAEEVVRFHSRLSLNFPPSEIYEVTPPEEERKPVHMTVAFMGLVGPLGVLPRHYTELMLERVRQRDYALRDFFDLFNHRLLSFFYRAWEKYRFYIDYERAAAQEEQEDDFSLSLFDLIGMGTKGLRGRLAVGDDALLFYAGLLAQHPRSASALAGVLQDYFAVSVQAVQFVGQWLFLSEENRTRLGPNGVHHMLGKSALIGDHVWDQQAKFTLRIGPLNFIKFRLFLPNGAAFRPLVQLTRFFVGQEHDFDVQLILRAKRVPRCYIGKNAKTARHPPLLGWSTWLTTDMFSHDAVDAVFAGDLTARDPARGDSSREARRSPA